MKNKILYIISGLLISNCVSAQEVLIFQNVQKDTSDLTYGPNQKYYTSSYLAFGFIFGTTDSSGSDLRWNRSIELESGARFKQQFGPLYALGYDFGINIKNYNIKQHPDKVFGGQITHKNEHLFTLNLRFLLFNRFNFAVQRGNHLGKYIDLGAYAEYMPWGRHIFKDTLDGGYGFRVQRTSFGKLEYVNRLNYGLSARAGVSILSFFFNYRLSDMLRKKDKFPYPELPRFSAGVSFDIERNDFKESREIMRTRKLYKE